MDPHLNFYICNNILIRENAFLKNPVKLQLQVNLNQYLISYFFRTDKNLMTIYLPWYVEHD